jgi:N-acetylglucosaminyldiphosphoundecaprenol N-acetyl-beta-D-mannosaminyltransferase
MKIGSSPPAGGAVILGTRIDNQRLSEVLERVEQMVARALPGQVITANVDQLVGNRRDPGMRALYRDADLVVPDGVPLLWAARFLKTPLAERVNGTDLMEGICALAARKGLPVFLLGGPQGIADLAARSLCRRFPGLPVVGTYFPDFGFEDRPGESETMRALLRERKPAILFVSLGYPKGVQWIARNLAACGIPVAIEVGSSFMYASGRMRRAPRWMQARGLEWLWRLGHEPRRLWKRYLLRDLPFFYHLVRQRLLRGRSGAN